MNRRHLARRHHPVLLMLMVLAALIALQVALHIWPLLLAAGAVWLGRHWWSRRHVTPARNRQLVPGRVVNDDAAELQQARAELDQVRAQVTRLEDAANRPIEAVIASYEHITRQYGDAAPGRMGRPQ